MIDSFKPHCVKSISKTTILGTLVFSLVIAGCGGGAGRNVNYSDLNSRAEQLIKDTIEIRALTGACIKSGGNASITAENTLSKWKDSYWQLVIGADQFVIQKSAQESFTYQGKSISLPVTKQFLQWYEESSSKVSFIYRSRNSRQSICERKLNDFMSQRVVETDRKGIKKYDDIDLELINYAQQVPDQPQQLSEIPSLSAISEPVSSVPKTLYQAEQLAKDQLCNAASIITLRSDWPVESYGAYCESKNLFIECHWGSCSVAR